MKLCEMDQERTQLTPARQVRLRFERRHRRHVAVCLVMAEAVDPIRRTSPVSNPT